MKTRDRLAFDSRSLTPDSLSRPGRSAPESHGGVASVGKARTRGRRARTRSALVALLALAFCGCSTSYQIYVDIAAGSNDSTDVDALFYWPNTSLGSTASNEAEDYWAIRETLKKAASERYTDYDVADLGTLSVAENRQCLILSDVDGETISHGGDGGQLVVFTTYRNFERIQKSLSAESAKISSFLGMFPTAYVHIIINEDEIRVEFVTSDAFVGNIKDVPTCR